MKKAWIVLLEQKNNHIQNLQEDFIKIDWNALGRIIHTLNMHFYYKDHAKFQKRFD